MPVCPECEHIPVQSCPMSVDRESYARVQARIWPDVYDGIAGATVAELNDASSIRLDIDQDAYATENFFKHRRTYEEMSHVEVIDVEAGVVDVWFRETQTTITAWRCPECAIVWDDTLGIIRNKEEDSA